MSINNHPWDKTKLPSFPTLEGFQQSKLEDMNDKLNKILWKLQEIENKFQQGKLPVWFVKENPIWIRDVYWTLFEENNP